MRPLYAVIPAQNTADTIPNVLRQLKRSGVTGCVVVVNGCIDETRYRAQREGARLGLDLRVVEFTEALGPDVPRAIGAYAAARTAYANVDLVFVDGDWKGAFGPALADFIAESKSAEADVSFVGSAVESQPDRPDLALWRRTLRNYRPPWSTASPSQCPLYIRTRTFRVVSPYELHHPGRWFAWCLCAARGHHLTVQVNTDWHPKIVGNPTKDLQHVEKMRATLMGDAAEGCCIVDGRVPSRRWNGEVWDGYHSMRRVDLLATYASSCHTSRD